MTFLRAFETENRNDDVTNHILNKTVKIDNHDV